MKKTIIFIAGLLTFVFLATACTSNTEPTLQEQADTGLQQEQLDDSILEEDFKKYDELNEQDIYKVSDCDEINDEWAKELCVNEAYFRNAVNENNISLCDKITQESEKNNCKNKVEEFNQDKGVIDLQPVEEQD